MPHHPHPSLTQSVITPANWPVAVLALMMFLTPAVGVSNELMLQDTLKSAVVALGVLTAATVFFWQQRQRTMPLLWHGMVWVPVVLMLYALGSMMWSHTYLAGVEAIRWFILSLLMWLGLNTLTQKNLPLLLWGIHGGAVVASAWAVAQFWFDLSLFPQAAAPSSTFINRNFFAEYAVSVLPLSVYLLATLRASRWPGFLVLMALSVAVNTVALLMTGTRSALLALLVMLPVLVFILARSRRGLAFSEWSKRWQIGVGLVLILGVLGLGSLPSGSPLITQAKMGNTALERSFLRVASMTEGEEYTERSFSIRAQMWLATARMMLDRPWTGVGAGAWEVQIPLHQRHYTVLETDYYAHNEYLQLLSEYGVVVGGLTLAFMLAYLLHAALQLLKIKDLQAPNAPPDAPLRAVVLTSLLVLLIVSNAGFPWHLASCGAMLALGLGTLAASDAQAPQVVTSALTRPLTLRPVAKALPIFTAGLLVTASVITGLAWQAERSIVHAIHLGTFLGQTLPEPAKPEAQRKAEMLASLRLGVAIHPHYRKFTAVAAEQLSASGDYANATWALETVVASRPNVAGLWSGLAYNYARLGQHDKALTAFNHVNRLKPDATGTVTLQATLLSLAGNDEAARQVIQTALNNQQFDFELLQTGYALGLKLGDAALAIQSLTLFNQTWPQHAADTYLRIGRVYAESPKPDDAKALVAFKQGLAAVPANKKLSYVEQLPERFRVQM
jgi:O-antigen ligase/tetratricopeptide (TPR) repeat protein